MALVSAVIVAAGRSQRMGFDKVMAPLAGRPVLLHTLDRFEACAAVSEAVLVVHPERRREILAAVAAAGLRKVRAVVDGGAERHLSVWAGLQAIDARAELVAVHDAARPLVQPSAITAAVLEAARVGAVALAAPVVETLKRADDANRITESVDRRGVWAMQTPQVFRREWLFAAYERVLARGEAVTDEVSAVQAAGHPVTLLGNPGLNPKITFPQDLVLAEHLLGHPSGAMQTPPGTPGVP